MSPLVTGRSISKMNSSRLTENEILYCEANMNEPGPGVGLGAVNAVFPHRSNSIGFHTHRTRESLVFSKHIGGNISCVSYIELQGNLLEVFVLPGGSLRCGVGKGASGLLVQPRDFPDG